MDRYCVDDAYDDTPRGLCRYMVRDRMLDDMPVGTPVRHAEAGRLCDAMNYANEQALSPILDAYSIDRDDYMIADDLDPAIDDE